MMVIAGNTEDKIFYIGEIWEGISLLRCKIHILIQVGKHKLKALVTKNIS